MPTKNLVVYYSFEGSTRLLAKTIAQAVNADIIECIPKKDLKSKGFSKYLWGGQQVLMKKKPSLEDFSSNPTMYEVVIIGTPVWAFTYAPAIRSFLHQFTLKHKKIGVFCCHEGSPGKTLKNLKKELADNELIGEVDFLDVVENKEKSIQKAKNWALDLKKKM